MTINLYSDTQTRPNAGMRTAMAGAEVGDEQRGQDPTTTALEERVAELLARRAIAMRHVRDRCRSSRRAT